MRWPAARISAPDQRATTRLLVFVAAELVLAMAIPFLLIQGYHTLLSSNAGTFVDSPSIDEPGWSALVSATPLTAVIEVVDGGISGATIIVPAGGVVTDDGSDAGSEVAAVDDPTRGGTLVLIPGDLVIPAPTSSIRLSDVKPIDAGDALADLLNVDFASVVVMDEIAWAQVLGDTAYDLDNPDPVPSDTFADAATGATEDDAPTELAFAVGAVSVDGLDAAVFLGRPVIGGSLSSVTPRRHDFWSAVLDDAPAAEHPLADAVRSIGPAGQVVELPTTVQSDGPAIDVMAAEVLLRDVVAFPSGSRLEIRVVDRTGAADLGRIAAQLAERGVKVVEIANAVQFDDGSTELIRPTDIADGIEQLEELVVELGLEPLVDPEQEHDTVTLLVGTDFSLAG